MPKAKLSQIASTWVDEDSNSKKKRLPQKKSKKVSKEAESQLKKNQTFSLKVGTIRRLWEHRIRTGRNISKTVDELVSRYLPKSN